MARNAKFYAALVAAFGGVGFFFSDSKVATATILSGPVDVIYQDNFAGPATNVNSPSNAIINNAPAVASGLDGGSASATYLSIPVAGSGAPDAAWMYSGSNSATISSPSGSVVNGEDSSTIQQLSLPFVPVAGAGYTYDLEATFNAPAGTGGHGLEMAYLYNNANNHNPASVVDAVTNNDPIGAILDRDQATSSAPSGYFDIFEGTGTSGDNSFAPSASALTGGSPGTNVQVDILYTPTSTTSGTMSWYLNGILANPTPVTVSGLTNGVDYIQFGDNRDAGGTITNFSLTAQSSVPEPASLGLLCVGGLLALRRRTRGQGQ